MFSDFQSVRLCMLPCFCASIHWVLVLLAQYLANQWMEFRQALVDEVVEGRDELLNNSVRESVSLYSQVLHFLYSVMYGIL